MTAVQNASGLTGAPAGQSEGVRKKKSGLPIASGVLSIVSGFIGLGLVTLFGFIGYSALGIQDESFIACSLFAASAVLVGYFLPFSMISIIGGMCCLKRRMWRLALAGAIAAILVLFPLGIPAVITTALSKKEFGRT